MSCCDQTQGLPVRVGQQVQDWTIDTYNPEEGGFGSLSSQDLRKAGKWTVLVFYPADFTFVCPTEIAAFGKLNEEFEDRDTVILGGSGDNEFSHFNWRATHEELLDIPFPMFSDIRHDLMRALGVENADGVADRATFIIDPDGIIQFVSVTPDAVGRNVDEVLRVLDALQSEEVCACNWQKNDPTKNIDKMDVLKQELK